MTTQAMTTERQDLIDMINTLPDSAVDKLFSYAAFLRYGDEAPNAETIAAFRELDEGGVEVTTIEEIMAELNAGN